MQEKSDPNGGQNRDSWIADSIDKTVTIGYAWNKKHDEYVYSD